MIVSANAANDDIEATPGEILKIDKKEIQIACDKGALSLTQLKLPNKPSPMNIEQLLNGYPSWFQKDGFFSVGKVVI